MTKTNNKYNDYEMLIIIFTMTFINTILFVYVTKDAYGGIYVVPSLIALLIIIPFLK